MFSVKGWSVDATALKPQTELFRKAATSIDTNEPTQQKKRKRGPEPPAQVADVGKLWSRHIEGKAPGGAKAAEEKVEKRKKAESEEKTAEPAAPNVPVVDESRSDEPAKKRKSKKQKLQNPEGNAEPSAEVQPKQDHGKGSIKQVEKSKPAPHVEQTKSAKPAKADPLEKLTPMQRAMRQKLISARFRHLNQTLYTEPSANALELFAQNPEMFEDYHSGFRQQVSIWPENPVDVFLNTLRTRGAVRIMATQKKLFREQKKGKKGKEVETPAPDLDRSVLALPRTHGACIIADLGCGDARLAHTFKTSGEATKFNLKIQSYDLHSPSPLVTKADISNIPAADGSVDVAIFCLALMGTNWISFIEEAYRILHWKGELWIAEIKSRFGRIGKASKVVEHSVGGKRKQAALIKKREAQKKEQDEVNDQQALQIEVDEVPVQNEETDVSAFVDVLRRRGFLLKNDQSSIDAGNRMFVRMEFIKAAAPTKGKGVPTEKPQAAPKFRTKAKFLDEDNNKEPATEDEAKVLKPCLYKIR